jgi:hypothetical protein
MSDDFDLTTDEALLSSISEHSLEELKLLPFSLLRQAVATDLCDPGGGFFNAVMTVWICTLPANEVLKAHKDFDEAKIKAFEWAENRGYTLASCEPLLSAYRRINDEWTVIASVRIKPSEHDKTDPNDGGQPTQSK